MNAEYARYAVLRALQAVVVVLLAYVLTFLIISVLPGDPVTAMLRDPQNGLSEQDIARIVAYYGLDKPVVIQLGLALSRFAVGNLGYSLQSNLPVSQIVGDALPSTLVLAAAALVLSILLAAALAYGALHALWAGVRGALRSIPSLFLSLPNFVIGLLLISWFAFGLRVFYVTDPNGAAATVFAALTLAIPVSAPLTEVFIANLDHEAAQEYAQVARSRGLSRGRLFARHLVKPSLLPVVTMIALLVGELLGGAVITETIFGRNGVGTVLQKAVTTQDIPVIQAVVSFAAVVFVAVNLLADLLSPLVDPRARLSIARVRPNREPAVV